MIQLKVYDSVSKAASQYIDLYEENPIKLNFSIEDITNTEAKSIFSRTFRVPGTSNNNKYFKWAFMVEENDFDVTVKKPAEIYVNGNFFRQGHIRLQKIYKNGVQDRNDYELLFMGETRDFSSAIGAASLCELDLSSLSHTLTTSNVTTSWQAYPSDITHTGASITPSFTNGLLNGDVIYPLVDFGNIYPLSNANPRIATGESHDFTNNDLPLPRLKPMVRAKALVDAIFDSTEYSYVAGGFFDSDIFKQIYVSAWGDEASVEQDEGFSNNIFQSRGDGDTPHNSVLETSIEITDPGNNYDPTTYKYNIPLDGTYEFYAKFYIFGSSQTTLDYPYAQVILQYSVNGGTWTDFGTGNIVQGGWFSGQGGTTQVTASLNTASTGGSISGGDTIEIRAYAEAYYWFYGGTIQSERFDCLLAPGPVNVAAQFDCSYKQIDFIKDMLTTFRLVMAPSRNNPTEFIIEPWVDYVGSGDVYDWSQKLDHGRDVVLEPLFDTQTDEIEFHHAEDKDYINAYHLDAYKDEYGYLLFDSANELLTGTREIKTNWAPTPIGTLEGAASTKSFILPLILTHNNEGEHEPIKPKTRLLFYNGLQSVDGIQWRLDGYGSALNYYPLVSNSSEWPMTINGVVLNWFNDVGYWGTVTGFPKQLGNSLYDAYWNGYIQSLYNKNARRMTATFILDDQDLRTFSFDDVIFVNGHYWRPEQIIDATVGQKSPVTVKLIKLLDFALPNPNAGDPATDEPVDDTQTP